MPDILRIADGGGKSELFPQTGGDMVESSPVYCLNVHKGEALADVVAALEGPVSEVRRLVSPEKPYAVGLRLSRAAATELLSRGNLSAFKARLEKLGLAVAHLNGFPYGAFHGTRVKEDVYHPDWTTRERLDYTLDLAYILVHLLPEGESGTISTVPVGYAADKPEKPLLAEAEAGLAALEEATGHRIVLAFEPEPDCVAEDADSLIAAVKPARHMDVCLDTCHCGVTGEDPLAAFAQYRAAGFEVARVQISAALTCPAAQAFRLDPFIDDVFLHQTRLAPPPPNPLSLSPRATSHKPQANLPPRATSHKPQANLPRNPLSLSFPDLTHETIGRLLLNKGAVARVHYHVPLFWGGDGVLGTTRGNLTDDFLKACRAADVPLEIETYTYDVMPKELRGGNLAADIAKEEAWLRERLARIRT